MALNFPGLSAQPPITGPIAPIAAPVAAQIPMARPLDSPENVCPRMARLFGHEHRGADPLKQSARQQRMKPRCQLRSRGGDANIAVPKIRSRRHPK